MVAACDLSAEVGVAGACRALTLPRAAYYRAMGAAACPGKSEARPTPARALSLREKAIVLEALNSERFCDMAPAAVYATLLDEDVFLCSTRTMYRILAGAGQVRERRDQLRHPSYTKPELLAESANQVWSWDITKLRGPVKWTYFYLYVILDIFSRYVVGWMVAMREAAELAKRLIYETCDKQGIEPGMLNLHADRGSSMKSKPVALLLTDLGVTKTHSRPYTSNDNPYSEAQFKTLKYRPEFPARFGSIEDARSFCQGFFTWYNIEHRHSGIGYMTPEAVHYGHAKQITEFRQSTLLDAFAAHPERFVNNMPQPPVVPQAVWINKPEKVRGEEVILP
jgi:putative transposase